MTLDEISVRFTADIAPFSAAAAQAAALLAAMGGQASSLASQFYSAGAMAGDGLRNGILSRQGAVVSAAHAVATAAANALRAALSIHSPSRLTFEVGRLFDEGLLEGISQSAGQVEKEADLLGHRAAQALEIPDFQPPVFFATPHFSSAQPVSQDQGQQNISITIPLEIDGYRLGVAAIDGINRVTQGSGRVELNL